MKRYARMGGLICTLCLILAVLPPAFADAPSVGLTILFTHDTHDHFLPDAADMGGYTRLTALLKEQREAPTPSGFTYPTITLDAGDFSMGSLFQTIYTTDAPELRALGAMGYDVTTLGNHEFDYRQQGLADMLNTARDAQDACREASVISHTAAMEKYTAQYGPLTLDLPAIVQANYTIPADPGSPEAQALTAALERYPVTPYTVVEREGLRIAVFGLMGLDSHECAPMSGMVYEPIIDAAKRTVAEIREKEKPDFVICLSHAGTEAGKGEDYELARAVDGIDLIISGHTHSTLSEPIEVNNTLIVSCGPYTQNLGRITIHKKASPDHTVTFSEYRLIPIDGDVPADADMAAMTERFKEAVDRNYLAEFGLGYDEVLASSQTDFTIAQTGDLIGLAYVDAIQEIEGDPYVPIAFAVAPDGVIRDQIRSGEVTTSAAFDILSLGSGSDGSPGYPLVSVYLTGKDLKNAFEVDASISQVMSAAELFGAGCWWEYNPHRMFLDRVTDCGVMDTAEDPTRVSVPIEDDRLYRVVADLYSGQMLGTVESKSFGLLSVTPRDESGTPVTDLESRIIRDKEGKEVKAWYALASYLKGQTALQSPSPSKIADSSRNPIRLLFPMGLPTLVVLLTGLAILTLVGFVLYRTTHRGRRKTPGYRPYCG